jgi:hypothetical protein
VTGFSDVSADVTRGPSRRAQTLLHRSVPPAAERSSLALPCTIRWDNRVPFVGNTAVRVRCWSTKVFVLKHGLLTDPRHPARYTALQIIRHFVVYGSSGLVLPSHFTFRDLNAIPESAITPLMDQSTSPCRLSFSRYFRTGSGYRGHQIRRYASGLDGLLK